MKNELEESWNKHKEKTHHLTGLYRDRCNFQAGFNAAFRIFGKNQIIPAVKRKPTTQELWKWAAKVSPFKRVVPK